MKTLLVLLAVAGYCLAAEAPYSPTGSKTQNGLLLLPLKQASNSTNTTTTPRPTNNGGENLEDVNARIMEQLRQQQGSEQGVYHVYLQDGRLQRIQYTTAPLSSAPQAASANYNQGQQAPEILSPEFAEKRGVYFVQVPQEKIQALVANGQQAFQQYSQGSQVNAYSQSNLQPSSGASVKYVPVPLGGESSIYEQQRQQHSTQDSKAYSNAQYNQQPSTPVNVRYVPLQESDVSRFGSSSQYRAAEPTFEAKVSYVPVPLGEESSRFQHQQQQQQQESGYVANVQYSEVEPIQGPVYSYSPSSLTRILRYAPAF